MRVASVRRPSSSTMADARCAIHSVRASRAASPPLRPMTAIEIVPLEMAEFRFPDPALAGRRGVVMGYAVRHPDGVLLFDTGFGFGNAELDETYTPVGRPILEVLREAGIEKDEITAVVNCHLHADHAGQNGAFPGIPIHVQPAEWEVAHTTDHTVLEWIDAPGRDVPAHRRRPRDHARRSGSIATPGHTPGHQSLVVDTARRHGRPRRPGLSTRSANGSAIPTPCEGRTSAPDQAAYDRSDRAPARARPGPRPLRPRPARSGRPTPRRPSTAWYPSRAVLGGELAVPCSLQSAPAGLNPLSRSPFSVAARRCDVEDRVPRSGEPRTVSGPEGSSTKRPSSGAAERPGPSRPSWWARATDDRRRVHGISAPRSPSTGGGRDHDRHRTRRSTDAGAPRRSARSSARRRSSRRSATRSGPTASSHAILFVGPRGTGKTSLARILAKAVNCTNLQDGDPCDALRGVRRRSARARRSTSSRSTPPRTAASTRSATCASGCAYPPGHLRRKVYILDEAHQITRDAWNALLKSLEEPPDFVDLHVRLDRAVRLPAGDPVAPPALRRPPPDDPRDRGQAAPDPRGRRSRRRAGAP